MITDMLSASCALVTSKSSHFKAISSSQNFHLPVINVSTPSTVMINGSDGITALCLRYIHDAMFSVQLMCTCSYMRRRIKGAARAINAIWRTTVLHFPVVGKYRTVAGFAPSFLSDTFTEQTYCFGVLLSPESAAAGKG